MEEVGEKLLILSEMDVSGEALPEVVWLLAVEEEAVVAMPTKVLSITTEAIVLVSGSLVVTVS